MTKEEKNYVDARQDLLKAFKSFNELTSWQKEQLAKELIGADTIATMYSILRHYFG